MCVSIEENVFKKHDRNEVLTEGENGLEIMYRCSSCGCLFDLNEIVSFTQYGKTKYICSECVYDNELDQKRRVGKFRIGYDE